MAALSRRQCVGALSRSPTPASQRGRPLGAWSVFRTFPACTRLLVRSVHTQRPPERLGRDFDFVFTFGE